ncbi:hydrogen gas-evolving membrane-bound hydrogenase subunit E [Pelagicoccus mobilis]|uniref:DUF4040 domain-containing protein n=1 Tax=Pelagicoccus mobilis TaxID=415221 RepID=A0A934VT65_9BACT|nr:hydrogen gas-evolving membrane-bound hydrogenase subunit E [Pelagicoccus mobilis]MBK1879199.1 DUF4040 domain-containing protein [Pelagicoccus mobilis]
MLLLVAIIGPVLGALIAASLCKAFPKKAGWILASIPAVIFVGLLTQVGSLNGLQAESVSFAWVPSLGVDFQLQLNGLGLLFALMIPGVGAFIFVYAGGYLHGHPLSGRFFTFLMLFMTGMMGIALSDNLIVFFVFWELTSISSYLLIGFNHEDEAARKKALQALLVTGFGGVAMLAGFILLATAGGSYQFSTLIAQGASLAQNPLAQAALPLLLLGAFTKSAQFPFQFWLPNAMAAPTPVSAYLHSATMVKAGVFLLFKLSPIYGGTPAWSITLITCGTITLLLGAVTGLFQRDLKRILAFTTMSVLGMLVLLIGIGGELALKSAILFMLGHALYKATLFMTAGNVDHGTGTREVTLLGGLRKAMPLTALAAGLAALSKGGFPPLLGFVSKEYVYKASIDLASLAPVLTGIAIVGNAMLLALAFKAGVHPYWSSAAKPGLGKSYSSLLPHTPHEVPFSMWIGPIILASLGLTFGFLPTEWISNLIGPALSISSGVATTVKVSLWHGFNLPLLLSLVTMALGILIYLAREHFWKKQRIGTRIERRSTERAYEFAFHQFVEKSKEVTLLLQNGSMRFYLWVILGVSGLLLSYKLLALGGLPAFPSTEGISILNTTITIAIVLGALVAAAARSIVNALAGLGVVGFGIALVYGFNGAPDLAITQIVVETLTVAFMLYAVLKLPSFKRYSKKSLRIQDAIFASCGGIIVFLLVLKSSALELAPTISNQLSEWSYPLAKGRNIVNVILVDFRALDTFGEIAVLGIAALGVSICLRPHLDRRQLSADDNLIFRVGANALLLTCIALSIVALYRGHNEPGGGFIGGLILAAGFILYAMAFGEKAARTKLRASPINYIGFGLALALVSGFFGPMTGKPFMSALWLPDFTLPLLGKVHLGTPLLFDVGVFLCVVGFTLQVVFNLQASSSDLPKRAVTSAKVEKKEPANCL